MQLAEAGRKHRDGWTKFCFYASNAEPEVSGRTAKQPAIEVISEVCYTYAELRDQPTGTNFGILGVLQYKTPDRILIVALLRHPLYQALPDNPGYIRLDGTVRVQLRYLAHDTCDYAGCYVRAEMRQSSLDRMKTAKAISFGFWDATGRVLSASLPSSGFGAALDGVPVPLEEQDETQRKILEIMRRRFADIAR